MESMIMRIKLKILKLFEDKTVSYVYICRFNSLSISSLPASVCLAKQLVSTCVFQMSDTCYTFF